MQITKFTDIALRVMMAVAADQERLFGISELSRRFFVSNNHMVKVVHSLVTAGFLESVRGRKGGVKIGMAPSTVSVGDIVRTTETASKIIDCKTANCPLFPECSLQGVLYNAHRAFYDVLDACTMADLAKGSNRLGEVINS